MSLFLLWLTGSISAADERERCAGLCFGRTGPVARKGAALEYLLLDKLRKRRNELRKIIKKTESSVKRAPDGILKYGRRKNTFEYYWKGPRAGRYSYIPKKNRKFAAALAQKGYDEKVLRLARQEVELISKLIKTCEADAIDGAYDNCPEGRKLLIEPVRPSDDEFREEWNKQPSCLLGFGENDPEFYTKRGERVRSKSEVLIANTLYGYGVDYLFECEIRLPGYGTANPDTRPMWSATCARSMDISNWVISSAKL